MLRITFYTDADGSPTGESYVQLAGALANRLGDDGLTELNADIPVDTIIDLLMDLLEKSGT